MTIYDGNGRIVDKNATIQIKQTGSLAHPSASFVDFQGTAVSGLTVTNRGVTVNLTAGGGNGSPQWVEGSPSPKLRTTASVAIGGTSTFAENVGADVNFYVSGTLTTGSSTDSVNMFNGNLVVSGNLFLLNATSPSQSFIEFSNVDGQPQDPSDNRLRLYGVQKASRSLLEFVGPNSQNTIIQPALFGNFIAYAGPNTTTTITSWGTNFTTSGTLAHNNIILSPVSGLMGSTVATRFTPAAAIGNGAGVRTTAAKFWRGNYSGSGGWFVHIRSTCFINAPTRCFIGLQAGVSNGFLGHQTDISASSNFIGIGWDRNDPLTGSWRVMRKDASNYTTEEIPNMNRPGTTGSWIDFICFAKTNATGVNVHVREHISTSVGVVSLDRWQGFYTTNIPTNTSLLLVQGGIFTQTGSAAGNWFLNRLYMESDF